MRNFKKYLRKKVMKFYVDTLGNRKISEAIQQAAFDAGYSWRCNNPELCESKRYLMFGLDDISKKKLCLMQSENVPDYEQYSIEQALKWFKENPKSNISKSPTGILDAIRSVPLEGLAKAACAYADYKNKQENPKEKSQIGYSWEGQATKHLKIEHSKWVLDDEDLNPTTLKRENLSLTAQLFGVKSELAKLKEENEKYVIELENRKHKIFELDRKIKKLEEENKKLVAEQGNLIADNGESISYERRLEERIKYEQKENADLNNRIEEVIKAAEKVNEEKHQAVLEITNLKQQLESYKKTNKAANENDYLLTVLRQNPMVAHYIDKIIKEDISHIDFTGV